MALSPRSPTKRRLSMRPVAADNHLMSGPELRPVRIIRLLRRPSDRRIGVFYIQVGNERAFYPFREISCAIGGRGFAVWRWGTRRSYHVRVGVPMECSCECLGYLFRRRCRHVLGLLTLIQRGKL